MNKAGELEGKSEERKKRTGKKQYWKKKEK